MREPQDDPHGHKAQPPKGVRRADRGDGRGLRADRRGVFRPISREKTDDRWITGIAYVVVTMREGRVIELKGCADRAAATTYAQTATVQN